VNLINGLFKKENKLLKEKKSIRQTFFNDGSNARIDTLEYSGIRNNEASIDFVRNNWEKINVENFDESKTTIL
jgi:hypothetical protein